MKTLQNELPLVHALTPIVELACKGLEAGAAPILEQVTETTAELLRFWFQQDYQDTRTINFHSGQRQALLNTIYAHEVLKPKTLGNSTTCFARMYCLKAPSRPKAWRSQRTTTPNTA